MNYFNTIFKYSAFIILIIFSETIMAQTYAQNYTVINGSKKIKYNDSFANYDINVKGKVKVNDDDTEIVAITPGGHLNISKKAFGNRREIEIESDSEGKLSFEYYEGRSKTPYDPEGKKWLSEILLDVIRVSGIAAEDRTKRIYSKNGVDGVINEIHMISSNSVMSLYFKALLDNFKLNENETVTVCKTIGTEMSSNSEMGSLFRKYSTVFMKTNTTMVTYFRSISHMSSNSEMGSVLRSISDDIDFNDPSVTESYFSCIDRMSSNSEIGSVLRHVEKNQQFTEDSYIRMLKSVKRLSSNSETGSVLRSLKNLNLDNDEIAEAYFGVINALSSNTEAGTTLKFVIKNYKLSDVNYIRLLNCVNMLSSNTEMGGVLKSAKDINLNNPSVMEAYFNSISHLSSNTESGSVLGFTIRNHQLNEQAWVKLLTVAARLSSNSELGSVLRVSQERMSFSETVLEAYFKATNRMSSSSDRAYVLRAVSHNSNLNKYACLLLLQSAKHISSSTEKSSVLSEVAKTKFISDKEVRSMYMDVASTISSGTEYKIAVEKIIDK